MKKAELYRTSFPNKTDEQIIESLANELGDKVGTISSLLKENEALKQKSSFTQDEDGYYAIKLFYIVQTANYWGKGKTIQEAIDNCKKASSGRFKKSDPYSITTYIVTNPDIEIGNAMEDVEINYSNITYKSANIQRVSQQSMNVKKEQILSKS